MRELLMLPKIHTRLDSRFNLGVHYYEPRWWSPGLQCDRVPSDNKRRLRWSCIGPWGRIDPNHAICNTQKLEPGGLPFAVRTQDSELACVSRELLNMAELSF